MARSHENPPREELGRADAAKAADGADGETSLVALFAALEQLDPAQRRRLLRRLRTSGLAAHDDLLTDRNRLQVAPALGLRYRRLLRRAGAKSAPANFVPAEQPPAPPAAEPPPDASYRSPVSGKVVVGAPESAAPLEPHSMAPLPGQAPEQPIVVIFDGGSRGNPGQGYGSYALRWPGQPQQIVQLRFGDRVTNNEAEYDTLIASLEAILKKLEDGGAPPSSARVEIRGDSLLVVNQVMGVWEVKEPRMQLRRARARGLLEQFGHWQIIHHGREHSVQTLGH
jgi:ribonuclease HI